jgi:hypothetical protein
MHRLIAHWLQPTSISLLVIAGRFGSLRGVFFCDQPGEQVLSGDNDIADVTTEQLTGTPPPIRADSGKADKRLAERLLRKAVQGPSVQGQQQDTQQGSGDEGQDTEPSFNDIIRGRAVRGAKTVELSYDQIMGVDTSKQDGEQGSASDFIRAAIDRKRAGRYWSMHFLHSE